MVSCQPESGLEVSPPATLKHGPHTSISLTAGLALHSLGTWDLTLMTRLLTYARPCLVQQPHLGTWGEIRAPTHLMKSTGDDAVSTGDMAQPPCFNTLALC